MAVFGNTLMPFSGNRLLLNLFPNATAAYSLRKLRKDYLGAVIRVRRSSDNTELDFNANQINNGVMLNWVGSGNGFVSVWYDQSGNGKNAIQTTAISQPSIVTNGLILLDGNKPTIEFNGTSNFLIINSYIVELSANDAQVIVVNKPKGSQGSYVVTEGDGNAPYSSNFIIGSSDGSNALWVNSSVTGGAQIEQQQIISFQKTGGPGVGLKTFNVFRNNLNSGVINNGQVNVETLNQTIIGSRADGTISFYNGRIQSVITYKNIVNNLNSVVDNINKYYTIY
jgi:hypothetical protein